MDPRFLDHFRQPRHTGELEAPSGRAEVENPVCGDRIVVSVRVAENALREIRCRVLGCSGAIAAASAMAELAEGRSLDELATLDRQAVDDALGGLPTLKRHGADLAVDGLRAALRAAKET